MAVAKEIRTKIQSIKNTQKITERWKWLQQVKCVKHKIAC